jgi:isoleucyl-tRNA synthetase
MLWSTVKDAIGRYWTMRGRRVERTWWWDCHGLPIEERVQKKLWLKSNADIEASGVKNFIDECYAYTSEVSSEWNWYVAKIGRWVDMDNAYRTMDQDYMESVMWVFSELWKKWLIYEGKRVSLYSWKLGTPISNFEVAMDDTYQEVNDPAITVKFALETNDKFPAGTSILAWTTTPWTIPANMALAVRNDIDYVLVSVPSLQRGMSEGQGDLVSEKSEQNPQSLRDSSFAKELTEQYIVAKNRLETVFKWKWEYTVIREFKWSELVGLGYLPPFPEYYYQKHGDNNHKIYHADFITDTDGTGIGHEAPEFGEVDFQLAKKEGIHISHAMDDAGRYTAEIHDYEWTHYLDLENPENGANRINIERMRANNTLFKLEGITHRVPFCPRSGTPLMQKAQKSWFIDIQSQKDKLIEANEQINWFPEYLKEWRFKKGIETAPDWCISRTRYWGAPMPVWIGEDGEKMVVSSREEIYEANKAYGQLEAREVDSKTVYYFKWGEYDGVEFNLHKPYIDSVLLQNPKATKAKKVLGVHGWTSRGLQSWEDGFWSYTKENLEKDGIQMDVPDFDKNEETKYALWRDKLDTLNIEQYDTIVWHSLGCAIIMQYIVEKEIKLNRLVLIAPSWLVGNSYLEKIIPEMTANKSELKKFVTEIVILHSRDDDADSAKFSYGSSLAEEISANLVTVNGFWHSMKWEWAKIVHALTLFGSPMTRIPEVLDVWMDSGSMPYAQMHYPFENKEAMQASFPADFIAEYVGQLRAWFYVMHVLGVLLNPTGAEKPTPSFTNVITTGVVNGNDGRKMSKSFGNYPDPRMAIEKYGADPIRFYMLNSPLLSGGDMDFKEEGIMETIKGVMLPIWNTYSFFTTYANIDKWEHDETEVWFSRHGESTSNIAGKMSDGNDNPELTEKGREQAKNAGKELKFQGKNFDVIIHTSRTRAIDTAHIIGDVIWFSGEYILDERFAEQDAGEFSGKTLTEVANMLWLPVDVPHAELRKKYKENKTENTEQFQKRILTWYEDVLRQYAWKKVLIVAHAGTSRPILHTYFGLTREDAYFDKKIGNAEPYRLMTTAIVNPLDQWILSKLQVLIGQVHDAMEGYDVSRGCRAIVDYMDELTNWYVRLSRRRFWESGMTADKQSAYETLYTVLTEVSKLLAPLMPFLSENIYQGLTGRESVHLEYITLANRHLVANDLNRDMDICEHIVSLGLTIRSKHNIRVRQPLQKIILDTTLNEYYLEIIRNELNVKEVICEKAKDFTAKICKVNARKVWPKYGKDMQEIIYWGKQWDFQENIDGTITINPNKFEMWQSFHHNDWPVTNNWKSWLIDGADWEIVRIKVELEEWVKKELGWYLEIEEWFNMVVALDTTITEGLKLEGYARDIIRLIQDMRKEADYQVTDRITLHIYGALHTEILSSYGEMIQRETLSTLTPLMVEPDIQKDIEIEVGAILTVQIEQ